MIIFRCDSSSQIGSGHVMRCLALSDLFKAAGKQVHFICADLPGAVKSAITERNVSVSFVGTSPENQIKECKQILTEKNCELLVVDSYNLDENFETAFASDYPIFVIDDLFNRKHNCDFLLDNNFRKSYSDLYDDKVTPGATVFMGPEHSLLRDEFWHFENSRAERKQRAVKKILVFFGGTDPNGTTLKLLNAVTSKPSTLEFDVIVSSSNQFLKQIKAGSWSSNIRILENPKNIAQLMFNSDLYLGSGGIITWERMFMGIPGVVITVAENQERIAKDLGDEGYQLVWGRDSEINWQTVLDRLEDLRNETNLLSDFSDRGRKLVGIFDVKRILEKL